MSALEKYQVKVFGASVDPPELNKQFAEKNQYNFPLLSDPEKKVAAAYGVLAPNGAFALRWSFIVDRDGILRRIDKMVKPGSAGKDLAAALEALGIPKR